MLSLHIFLFIQTLFQLTARAMQMAIIYAVAEAVIPVVNGIGSKVIGVIDTSNGLDGIAATTDIKSVKGLKVKIIADKYGCSMLILVGVFMHFLHKIGMA